MALSADHALNARKASDMATVIGLALLLWLARLAYRDGRSAVGGRRSRNPVLRQLDRDPDGVDLDRLRHAMGARSANELPGGATPDTLAEARETELTGQLFAGAMSPSDYHRLMSELAYDSTQSEGSR